MMRTILGATLMAAAIGLLTIPSVSAGAIKGLPNASMDATQPLVQQAAYCYRRVCYGYGYERKCYRERYYCERGY